MKRISLIAFLLLATISVASGQSTEKTEYKKFATEADVPRISLDDAKKDYDAKNVVIIDARSAEVYKTEHIVGAISIPLSSDPAEYGKIPKGKKIIVYCS